MRILYPILIGVLVIAGCSNTRHSNTLNMEQAVPSSQINLYPEQKAEHLEHLAASFPGVQGVHVVMLGTTAIVGINVKPNLPRTQVDNLKFSVVEALHKDPDGAHAVVTADVDLNQRIINIRQAIMNGRPISGFANELGTIVARIVPQLPIDNTTNNSTTNNNIKSSD